MTPLPANDADRPMLTDRDRYRMMVRAWGPDDLTAMIWHEARGTAHATAWQGYGLGYPEALQIALQETQAFADPAAKALVERLCRDRTWTGQLIHVVHNLSLTEANAQPLIQAAMERLQSTDPQINSWTCPIIGLLGSLAARGFYQPTTDELEVLTELACSQAQLIMPRPRGAGGAQAAHQWLGGTVRVLASVRTTPSACLNRLLGRFLMKRDIVLSLVTHPNATVGMQVVALRIGNHTDVAMCLAIAKTMRRRPDGTFDKTLDAVLREVAHELRPVCAAMMRRTSGAAFRFWLEHLLKHDPEDVRPELSQWHLEMLATDWEHLDPTCFEPMLQYRDGDVRQMGILCVGRVSANAAARVQGEAPSRDAARDVAQDDAAVRTTTVSPRGHL